MATSPERPFYFEGQYLGAADLAAAIDYARTAQRTAMLAGQSWGIHIGLELAEQEDSDGTTGYYVMPGCATDGYGRLIVVGAPAPVSPALFASLPSGNQMVWIRYDEGARQGLRPGWQTCGDQDQFARIRESFRIEAGPLQPLDRRQSGVTVAGVAIAEAREALNRIDSDAPYICDGSLPYQDYPADDARWLVPLGVASWTAGAPGSLGARTLDQRKISRTFRRYAGQVAETIHAADGVIRLRDRYTDTQPGKSVEDLCAASAIRAADLAQSVNGAGMLTERLVGTELVWIEGHARFLGDARMWSTKVDFRTVTGGEAESPMFIMRGDNTAGGSLTALELALGSAPDGDTTLVAGPVDNGTVDPRLVFSNKGQLAVGSPIPADFKGHTLVAITAADTGVAIAAAGGKLARLVFAEGTSLVEKASLTYDDSKRILRFGTGVDLMLFSSLDGQGRLGVRSLNNDEVDNDADDVLVKSDDTVGLTLLAGANQTARINFGDVTDGGLRPRSGSILYRNSSQRMELWSDGDPRVTITATGRVGLGTTAPSARLQIESPDDNRRLLVDPNSVRAEDGGSGTLLTLQSSGGALQVGSSLRVTPSGRIGIDTTDPLAAIHVAGEGSEIRVDASGSNQARLRLSGGGTDSTCQHASANGRFELFNRGVRALCADSGRIGINLGTEAPQAELHVRGNKTLDAGSLSSHVAVVENMGGANADVLALKVNAGTPQTSNNFITFFAGNTAIASVEGNGAGGVTFSTSSADFAERLPRAAVDPIGPGLIVGLSGGKVSLDTASADSIHVTTDRAAVLGNVGTLPHEECENVALLGQVAVRVRGPVRAGQRIVPSGRNDGRGRAATASDAPQSAIGRAWTSWEGPGEGSVIVAVGLADASAARDLEAQLVRQQECIAALIERIDRLEAGGAR